MGQWSDVLVWDRSRVNRLTNFKLESFMFRDFGEPTWHQCHRARCAVCVMCSDSLHGLRSWTSQHCRLQRLIPEVTIPLWVSIL